MIVVPLFLGILQVGLFLYVRNTVTAAASEGAHYAAVLNREPADGAARTRELVERRGDGRADRLGRPRRTTDIDGQPGVVVSSTRTCRRSDCGDRGSTFTVEGHAMKETGE